MCEESLQLTSPGKQQTVTAPLCSNSLQGWLCTLMLIEAVISLLHIFCFPKRCSVVSGSSKAAAIHVKGLAPHSLFFRMCLWVFPSFRNGNCFQSSGLGISLDAVQKHSKKGFVLKTPSV